MNDLISKSRLKNELSKIPCEMGLIKKVWVMQAVDKQKAQDSNNTCNCQHNNNSRGNEPCCRCDSKQTNADRIRKMSDEEMAKRIASSPNFNCADYCDSFTQTCAFNCNKKGREIALKWLQSEAE